MSEYFNTLFFCTHVSGSGVNLISYGLQTLIVKEPNREAQDKHITILLMRASGFDMVCVDRVRGIDCKDIRQRDRREKSVCMCACVLCVYACARACVQGAEGDGEKKG